MLTSTMTMIFKIAAQYTQIKHFWFQILEFLFLQETLQLIN